LSNGGRNFRFTILWWPIAVPDGMADDATREMTTDSPPEDFGSVRDIEGLLVRMAPAQTPAEALAHAPTIDALIGPLDPTRSVDVLAGLMTEPRFQANGTRLEWAIRMVLALASGHRRPKPAELAQLLNSELATARVNRLEDPIEDFFVEPVLARRGDFLILSGYWEKAAISAEMVIDAFAALPTAPQKADAQEKAFALLRLSDALVERAGLQRYAIGSGDPNGDMLVPSDTRLNTLARRVRFSWDEIEKLGIHPQDLAPYVSLPSDRGPILAAIPGDSPLELRPLVKTKHGLIIASPTNISTAVRALLIEDAVTHGLDRALQANLLQAKTALLRQTGFEIIATGPIRMVEDQLFRESVHELSTGRYVHVIQSMDGFANWPERAFGAVTGCGPEWVRAIEQSMREARAEIRRRPNYADGMTVWLPAGWGAGRSFPSARDGELADWPLLALEPADAAVATACEDGKASDLWRLNKQLDLVHEQGFEFFAINGFLNLFHWWRKTDHALIPPDKEDIRPPVTINFDTNLLLEARRESAETLDRRMLLHPSGTWHLVAKLERGALARVLEPIYGSLDAARRGTLVGVSVHGDSTWWIELNQQMEGHNKDIFETWRMALMWTSIIMAPFLRETAPKRIMSNIVLTLTLDGPPVIGSVEDQPSTDQNIDAAIGLSVGHDNKTATIELQPGWHRGLYRPDNYAEAALATAIFCAVSGIFGLDADPARLKRIVMQAAGSTDYRHRHAFQAHTAIDGLRAEGLITRFEAVPASAAALAKCGSAWPTHPRERGMTIEGKEVCLGFLNEFIRERQSKLRNQVRRFDRKALVVASLERLQSAIGTERHWARSARALRAIHGIRGDFELSLESGRKANSVMRGASILTELAVAESPLQNGRAAGRMDMEELQADAVQLFQAMDMVPAFHADRIEPTIHFSPTGDVLYVHDFEEATIKVAAELRHARERTVASDEYVARFSREGERAEPDRELMEAIAAEYHASAELVGDFANALAFVCRSHQRGVLVVPRSQLVRELETLEYLRGQNVGPLVDRLTLPARNGWDDIPPGFRPTDFDLGKFDRRLSAIGRPIIALSSGSDPELVVAPGVVERAFVHNIGGAAAGALQNEFWQSAKMRSYVGSAAARAGMQFNESVAGSLSKLGLRASPSVKPSWCLNEKNTDELKRLGDIDVLAVSGNKVWVVEAKDLKLCRTLGEAARRLSEYRGLENRGKPDALLRHLRRVEYLRTHAASLVQRLHLSSIPQVHGVMIVNAPQPMQQLHRKYSADSTVVMLDEIGRVPWADGWKSKPG
jgi:hypothetical protein